MASPNNATALLDNPICHSSDIFICLLSAVWYFSMLPFKNFFVATDNFVAIIRLHISTACKKMIKDLQLPLPLN